MNGRNHVDLGRNKLNYFLKFCYFLEFRNRMNVEKGDEGCDKGQF